MHTAWRLRIDTHDPPRDPTRLSPELILSTAKQCNLLLLSVSYCKVIAPPSLRDGAQLPRRAGWRRQLEFEKNDLKSKKAMEGYRYGFRLWWRSCPAYLRKIGMGKEGSFEKTNQHGGRMFALPGEFSLNAEQAAQILWKCYKSRNKLTFAQIRQVKRTLSYAYQLQGGVPGKNFETIPGVWLVVQKKHLKPQEQFIIPTRIPQPEELCEAFTKEYSQGCGMSFPDWTRGLLIAWDWTVCGARSKEDLDRVKKGEAHDVDHAEGWGWTEFKGGRSKLCKAKKGERAWRMWRVCMCPDGKHKPMPKHAEHAMKRDGTLTEDEDPTASWCTVCPLNAMEFVIRTQSRFAENDEKQNDDATNGHVRIYRKWNKNGRPARVSEGEPVEHALRWLRVQGLKRNFQTNAGRKALSRWLQQLEIPHAESVHVHGDCEDVWVGSYQTELAKKGDKDRLQSTEPDTACLALRKFAWQLCKRGRPLKSAAKAAKVKRIMEAAMRQIAAL